MRGRNLYGYSNNSDGTDHISMKSKTGHFRERLIESRRKRESIASKNHEISLTEGLLKTYEELPEEKRDYDIERRLRAKLRAKKCQLQAMCP